MKITVLLDEDPAESGDELTLRLMEALALVGHEVDCLIADEEVEDAISRKGVQYSHIPFSQAYPALSDTEPSLVLSAGEMGIHARRMASYLEVPSVLLVLRHSTQALQAIGSTPELLVFATDRLRQDLIGEDVSGDWVVVENVSDTEDFLDHVQSLAEKAS